jgi:hypothetical protein
MIIISITAVLCTACICLFLLKLNNAILHMFGTLMNIYDSLEKINITLRLNKTEPVIDEPVTKKRENILRKLLLRNS